MECLSDILANTFDAVICCTGEQQIVTEWNAAAERIFGIPADQAKGQPAGTLTSDPGFAALLRDVAAGEALQRRQYNYKRHDGTTSALEVNAVRLPVEGAIMVIAREQSGRSIDELLASLSHELRTPLTPVLMTAGALREDMRIPEDAREQLAMIERNVALQARLIDELLARGGTISNAPVAGVTQDKEVADPLRPSLPESPVAAGPSLRLLLVEDHESTLQVISRLLTRAGHQVVTAGTLGDALSAAKNRLFDVVISDLGLPDGTGNELMEILRARYGLRGIALTGYGSSDDIARSHQAGFAAHLTKPVDFGQLQRALAEVSQTEALR